MSTQVQVRGASQATQEARTLAAREIDVNTTDKRISIHDGSTAGGVPHATCFDTQNNEWTYASASGTNTITITLAKAPASYQAGQTFTFKAANTITGSSTINVNTLGALTLKKKDVGSGSLVVLASGDIISGGIYTAHILDGSNALIEGIGGGSITSVSQGDLNTSTGTISQTPSVQIVASVLYRGSTFIAMPGGQYGFCLESKHTNADIGGWMFGYDSTSYSSRVVSWSNTTNAGVGGQQRYITSSPPFDLGDGEAGGFIFLLMDSLGKVVSHYAADVPPWGYNGPTDIRAKKVCRITKKKYRYGMRPMSIEQIIDGANPEYEYQEITQQIKNADMVLIPHPFGVIPSGHTVVLLDMMDERLRRLVDYQNGGGDISEALMSGKIYADNEHIKGRNGPLGVMQARLKFRKSK